MQSPLSSPPLPPPALRTPPSVVPPGSTQPPQTQGGGPVPPFTSAPLPPYPMPSPPLQYPYIGYQSPAKRRVPWWGQMIALVVPPPIALILGSPIWGLLLWATYGDSPTPPSHADVAAKWLTGAYIAVGVLWGLGIHAIVIRKPWFLLAGFAVTIGLICGVIWAYANLY